MARCHAGHREDASPLLRIIGGTAAAYFDASRSDGAKAGAPATTATAAQEGIGRLSWRPRLLCSPGRGERSARATLTVIPLSPLYVLVPFHPGWPLFEF
jgi:hypothetical protein